MRTVRTALWLSTIASLGLLLNTAAGCTAQAASGKEESAAASAAGRPAVITIAQPARLGEMERPAAVFDHAKHTNALGAEGCKLCHERDALGHLDDKLVRLDDGLDREALMGAYHDRCIGCHKERGKGARACGECHVKEKPPSSAVHLMRFDSSLHHRHQEAAEGRCEICHHPVEGWGVPKDPPKDKRHGACSGCHGDRADGRKLPLRRASHRACVGCHLDREAKEQKSGPPLCAGCHDPEAVAQIKQLPEVPRLKNEQRDTYEIASEGAKMGAVTFDHVGHEGAAHFCTSCHHRSTKACASCHPIEGSPDGGGVTLEAAQHLSSSEHSCVGCHQREAGEASCAGCHQTLPEPPSKASCLVCHGEQKKEAQPVQLPPASDDFPAKVTIDLLARDYGPSTMPHETIVRRLQDGVAKSRLAQAFHAGPDTLCAGCHHHSPAGKRPPSCRSCHSGDAARDKDRPSLKAAYHRQCMDCHREMKIDAMGCTDCHAEAGEQKGEKR
jgi:hypothetical protein